MATAKSEKNSDSVKIVSTTEHDSNAIAARHGLTIHPAAKLFAMQNGDEIRALADDIKRNGQRVKIAVQKKVNHCQRASKSIDLRVTGFP